MNDETPTTKTTPRETLTGDRLCMQCLHPLVGRTIEREATTGLLYVRCGECATASALFEYPTAAPWMHRMKTVAASTFAVFAIFAVLALGGVTGGFTAGSAQVATDASAASIVRAFQAAGGSTKSADGQYEQGPFGSIDEAWVESAEGQVALKASRRDLAAFIAMITIVPLGSVIAIPFALLLGIAAMRRPLFSRALWSSLPAAIACLIAVMYGIAYEQYSNAGMMSGARLNWQTVAEANNLVYFSIIISIWFVLWSAMVAAIAPSLLAGLFRFILPPRDRRLVACIWEWSGLPVPKR